MAQPDHDGVYLEFSLLAFLLQYRPLGSMGDSLKRLLLGHPYPIFWDPVTLAAIKVAARGNWRHYSNLKALLSLVKLVDDEKFDASYKLVTTRLKQESANYEADEPYVFGISGALSENAVLLTEKYQFKRFEAVFQDQNLEVIVIQ